MKRTFAILGSALFFVVAPCLMAGLIPWWITRWQFGPPFLGLPLTRTAGVFLILAGIPGLIDSYARFALLGLGTPAPIAPPQHLVITGLYRYVRNPIYVAVIAFIVGQTLLFGDWRLLVYGALFCVPRVRRELSLARRIFRICRCIEQVFASMESRNTAVPRKSRNMAKSGCLRTAYACPGAWRIVAALRDSGRIKRKIVMLVELPTFFRRVARIFRRAQSG